MVGGVLRPVGGFGMRAEFVGGFCVGRESRTKEEACGRDRGVRGIGGGRHCGGQIFQYLKRAVYDRE